MQSAQAAAPPAITLDTLDTPCLILDRGRLQANIARMAARTAELGVALRPHLKTPKSVEIARLLMSAGAQRFAVSTVLELETMAAAEIGDLFYAVPLDARKVTRVAPLLRGHGRISFLTDDPQATAACAEAAQREGVVLEFWVEIDVDHYRTGVAPDGARFADLLRLLRGHPHLRLAGLMSHGGASYNAADPQAVADLTEAHRLALLGAADRAVAAGHDRPRLSFGSTPAVLHARTLDGIDEVRCGIYPFQDLFQAGIGAARIEDIALSVLTTIVSAMPDLNRIVIDAGGLALSKDRSTQGHAFDAGYGLLCDAEIGRPLPDLYVSAVSQELGIVTTRSGAPLDFARLAVGGRLRILPNHADMTAAAYETYHIVDPSPHIAAVWSRRNGW